MQRCRSQKVYLSGKPDMMMGMSTDDTGADPFYSALVALTKRKLGMSEIYDSVGLGSSQYNDLRKAGKLVTPDRVINAARHFKINPVELLAECGLIDPREAIDFVERRRRAAEEFLGIDPNHPPTANGRGVATTTASTTRRLTKMTDAGPRRDVPNL